MDSSSHTTPAVSEIDKENFVAAGTEIILETVDSKIVNETWVSTDIEFITEIVSRADAWIRHST